MILDIVLNHTVMCSRIRGSAATASFSPAPYLIQWRDAQGNPYQSGPSRRRPTRLRTRSSGRRRCSTASVSTRQGIAQGTVGDFYGFKQLNTVCQDGGRFPVRDALIAAYAEIIRQWPGPRLSAGRMRPGLRRCLPREIR